MKDRDRFRRNLESWYGPRKNEKVMDLLLDDLTDRSGGLHPDVVPEVGLLVDGFAYAETEEGRKNRRRKRA